MDLQPTVWSTLGLHSELLNVGAKFLIPEPEQLSACVGSTQRKELAAVSQQESFTGALCNTSGKRVKYLSRSAIERPSIHGKFTENIFIQRSRLKCRI